MSDNQVQYTADISTDTSTHAEQTTSNPVHLYCYILHSTRGGLHVSTSHLSVHYRPQPMLKRHAKSFHLLAINDIKDFLNNMVTQLWKRKYSKLSKRRIVFDQVLCFTDKCFTASDASSCYTYNRKFDDFFSKNETQVSL